MLACMPLYRFQVSQGADSAFPEDRIVNTVHMFDVAGGSNVEAQCQALLDVWQAEWVTTAVREMRVTAYDVGPPPNLPIASVVENEGSFPVSTINREIALCLSYYGVRSNPRKRGRLYMCPAVRGAAVSAARPPGVLISDVLDVGDALAACGGAAWDWVVYSRLDNLSTAVVGTWCDNAWDVVRSRGLSPTDRTERTPGP